MAVILSALAALYFPPALFADIKGDIRSAMSYDNVIANARASGMSEEDIVKGMILTGAPPGAVAEAALRAGFSPASVIPTAITTGMSSGIAMTTFNIDKVAYNEKVDVETVVCLTVKARGIVDELIEASQIAGYPLDIITEFLCSCGAELPLCDRPMAAPSDTRDLPYASPSR